MERQTDSRALAQGRDTRWTTRMAYAGLLLAALVAIGVAVGPVIAPVAITPVASAPASPSADVVNAGPADAPAVDRLAAVGASVQNDEATNDSADAANDSEANATELAPIDPANATANDTESIELEGEGQTVTDPVALDDGLLVVSYAHEGESNVQMWLWNESADERQTLLVNQIGTVNGTTAAPVAAGNYSLEVAADGAWNATLVQPNATAVLEAATATNETPTNATDANGSNGNGSDANATDPGANATNADRNATDAQTNRTNARTNVTGAPATASGNGSAVLGPVQFEDSVTVTGNHTGESNFVVWLWSENATSLTDGSLVFNEIGEIANAETRVGHSDVAWVVVQADGEWDVAFD